MTASVLSVVELIRVEGKPYNCCMHAGVIVSLQFVYDVAAGALVNAWALTEDDL